MDLDLDLFGRRDDRGRRYHDDDDDDRGRRRRGRRYHEDDRDDDRDRDDDDDDRFDRRRAHGRQGRDRHDDDGRDHRRRPRGLAGWSRRDHPHLFSWLLLGGGVVLLGLALIAVATSLGLWGTVADGWFAATRAVLPTSWHDEWMALPGVVHVAIGLGALFVAAGVAGEVLD